jgi:CRISPR-associated protein Cas5t
MAGLKVLKVETSAHTASFRYPRIQVGRLPTFDMPPPATIYGHLASVMGDWFDPEDLSFAYSFRHSGKATDLETFHPIERGSGKTSLRKRGWDFPVNVQCSTNVQYREFLVHPRLTLYLQSADSDLLDRLRQAFISPFFSYLLGRSQDLATCHTVVFSDLVASSEAFFADTLLPFEWRPWVSPGTTVLLPYQIDYRRVRTARQERFLQVTRPALYVFDGTDDVTSRSALPEQFLTDPDEVQEVVGRKLARGLHFFPVRGPDWME